MEQSNFKENVILVDADFVNSIAYNLSSNFEKMIGRNIPDADIADWLVCAALDGGVPVGKNTVQVFFIHQPETLMLEQFRPGELHTELDGTSFMDPKLGEFQMSCLPIEFLADEDFFSECAKVLLGSKEVKRLVLVPDIALSGDRLNRLMKDNPNHGKQVTLLSMTPQEGFEHVMLGYSLMHAMGIKGEEL